MKATGTACQAELYATVCSATPPVNTYAPPRLESQSLSEPPEQAGGNSITVQAEDEPNVLRLQRVRTNQTRKRPRS